MGRTQRALTSLVAAIPAGVLSYLLVRVFLDRADSLNTTLKVVVGISLVCAAVITLMPFGLLILGGKKAASDEEKPTRGKSDDLDEVDEDAEEVANVDDDGEASEDADEELAGSSAFDLDDDDADVMADSDDEISTKSGNDSSLDEIETADDFEDAFDDEDEPKPKKKKR